MRTSEIHRLGDLEECRALAEALGDTPETVDAVHLLRRGLCKAFVAGAPSRFDGAIVQSDQWPAEPTAFGSNPETLWELLKVVKGWDCVLVETECAGGLGQIVEAEMGVRVRTLDDVYLALNKPAESYENESVRELSLADLELLESAPEEFRESLWGSTAALLSEGIVACGIVDGRIAGSALAAARSARHAGIAVCTEQVYRNQGLATAAAAMVAKRVQEAGQVPVWSAGAHNAASLRVAEKLGFVEVSRRRYVIAERESGDPGVACQGV